MTLARCLRLPIAEANSHATFHTEGLVIVHQLLQPMEASSQHAAGLTRGWDKSCNMLPSLDKASCDGSVCPK